MRSFLWSSLIYGAAVIAPPLNAAQVNPLAPIETYAVRPAQNTVLGDGYDALALKDYTRAEKLFREVIKTNPKSPSPLIAMAELARVQGKAAEAEDWIRKAVAVSPNSAESQLALARLYISKHDWKNAEQAYLKVVAADPKALPLGLGELYLNGMNRPEQAAEQFRRAVSMRGDHAGARFGLGSALLAMNDVPGAIREMREAARLEPANALAHHGLGRALMRKAETKEAIAEFQKALELQPKFFAAALDLGDAQMATGQGQDALKSYQAAIKLDAKSADPFVKMGMAYQQMNMRKEAYDAYLSALRLDPKQILALNNLAWMSAEYKERLDEGLKWAKQATVLAPKALPLQDTLASVYIARGEKSDAIGILEKIAADAHPPADSLYRLGLLYAEQNDKKKAVVTLRRALQVDPNFANARDAAAKIKTLEKT